MFHSRWCIRFSLGCVADEGKYTIFSFLYQEDVGCVCMLNDWYSCYDDFCADNYNYSRFMLVDKCRSEKWEVCLHGDMTIIRYLPRQLQLFPVHVEGQVSQ